MDARNLLSLSGVLLVIGAAGYYWGMGHPKEVLQGPEERRPDYVVTNIRGTETDTQGRLLRKLTAPELRHYDKPEDVAEMDQPVMTLFDQGREAWQLSARQGQGLKQGTEVVLQGQVHAERRDPAALPVTFDTESLHVFPKEEKLYGEADVKIKSPRGQLSSRGIQADMKTGDLVLNQKVQGNYAPAPR